MTHRSDEKRTQPESGDVHVGDITESNDIAISVGARVTLVEGDLVISRGDQQITIPRTVQIAIAAVALGIIFLVAVQITNLRQASRLTPMTGDFNVALTFVSQPAIDALIYRI